MSLQGCGSEKSRSKRFGWRIAAAAFAFVCAAPGATSLAAQTAHDRPAAIVVAHGAEAEWN